MEAPDLGVLTDDKPVETKRPKHIQKSYSQRTPWLAIFLVVLVITAGMFYLSYNGYFKTEVTQSVEPQINISSPVDIDNNYEIINDHTIVNNFSIKIWIEGDEVEVING